MSAGKRILLLSAYDAVSHRYWREGLAGHFPEHAWTVLQLPPRHFAWRLRGNAMSWAFAEREALSRPFDLIVATSMADLATLKGLLPSLAGVPAVVYFHENQFDYPANASRHGMVEAQITSIYTALAADRLAFNSAHNRDTFLAGAEALIGNMPDARPKGLRAALAARSRLLPVPLADDLFRPHRSGKAEIFTLVWNHRWEYDKAPERLLAALRQLKARGIDFRLQLLGQQFRSAPAVFETMRDELAAEIVRWGHVAERDAYLDCLRRSHVALSTSLHDFQGLALQEAVACGALPLAPKRLAYPEYLPEGCLYDSHPDDGEAESTALAARLAELAALHERGCLPAAPDLSHLGWPALDERYRELLL